ncbi:DUF4307 domain-containing protein [Kitasatospora mediocidica]|uniref:DUF4307 domain-containing protein n=1 Tax=Kitasatospora mediocidica TaxID=58352 RepID=UPI000561847C|nr:DUF4307 domain-containing protein [Kitasatospora mediocidica]
MNGTTTAPAGVPEGRYGSTGNRAADRKLKVVGTALGVLAIALIAWLGSTYVIQQSKLNGTVVAFQVVSDSQVQVQLSVSKDSGTSGICTIRSQSPDGTVVGQTDVAVPSHGSTFEQVVTIRTTARGTTGELLSCTPTK